MMGTIALVVGDSRVDSKRKKKDKNSSKKKIDKEKSQEESSSSKKNPQKKNKGEMSKCAYCSKGYHPESYCVKK